MSLERMSAQPSPGESLDSCISGDLARESPYNLKKKPPRRLNVRGHDLEVFRRRGKKRLADQPPQVKLGGGFFVVCKKQ